MCITPVYFVKGNKKVKAKKKNLFFVVVVVPQKGLKATTHKNKRESQSLWIEVSCPQKYV